MVGHYDGHCTMHNYDARPYRPTGLQTRRQELGFRIHCHVKPKYKQNEMPQLDMQGGPRNGLAQEVPRLVRSGREKEHETSFQSTPRQLERLGKIYCLRRLGEYKRTYSILSTREAIVEPEPPPRVGCPGTIDLSVVDSVTVHSLKHKSGVWAKLGPWLRLRPDS